MAEPDVDVVLDQFAAVNERDFPRAMSRYAEDVELVVHPDAFLEAGGVSGREAVGRWFGEWFRTFEPGFHFQIEEARELGERVLLVATLSGRGRTSGIEVHREAGYLYTVREGKVARAEIYRDRAAALEAAGVED
jgi:ketosteroid isomerase-like protein